LQFSSTDKVAGKSSACWTAEKLDRRQRLLGIALGTVNHRRNFLDDQCRSLQGRALAGNVVGKQQRFLYNTGEHAELQMHGMNLNISAARRLLRGALNNAHCYGKLVHVYELPIANFRLPI